jgi:hypothetical protein
MIKFEGFMVTENNEDFSDDHPPDIYSDDGDGSL